jgi:hypothetical protein
MTVAQAAVNEFASQLERVFKIPSSETLNGGYVETSEGWLRVEFKGVTIRLADGVWGVWDTTGGLCEGRTLEEANDLHTAEYNKNYPY